MFVAGERSLDELACGIDSAYQLNHQITAVIDNFFGMRSDECSIDPGAFLHRIAHENSCDAKLDAASLADECTILVNQFDQSAADGATAKQSDFQLLRRHCCLSSSTGLPPAIDGTSRTSSPSWKA